MSAVGAFGMLFAREFLQAAQRMPRLNRVMLALVACWVVSLLIALLLSYRLSSLVTTALAVISVSIQPGRIEFTVIL